MTRSYFCVLILSLLLQACSNNRGVPEAPPEPEPRAPAVGQVQLKTAAASVWPLDVGIAVFDQGLDNRTQGARVFPTVRKAESLLIPVTLSSYLEDSGAWGAVRVVHSNEVFMPLILDGEILRADGAVLELQLRFRAADGSLLLERIYRDEATASDYPVKPGGEPFDDIYRAISNDLLEIAGALTQEQRLNLQRLSLMRFAATLSPASFERFVTTQADGGYSLASFPADGDPMLLRLARVRRQDDLFIDAVDEQYADLRGDVEDSYALWREYNYELQRFGDDYRTTASERKSTARRGTFAAMQQVYASYRKVKIQEEDLRELVKGFSGESLETVLEVDDGVFRLSGSVQDRYAQWRQILTRINALETGGQLPGTP
ncbi:hypothetical protein R0135_03930 [Congregibacter variabilis]|uniref:Lipoprotein n=1 Tax=Congregibacter variabilis TaxID=3081200 RepID=A0ABZ0I529_9GAMM|nr:hypothetical protein R0135_03930 [Congregibacter sp. IMCC43200]